MLHTFFRVLFSCLSPCLPIDTLVKVIDRFLASVPNVLSPHGILYLVLIKENKPGIDTSCGHCIDSLTLEFVVR